MTAKRDRSTVATRSTTREGVKRKMAATQSEHEPSESELAALSRRIDQRLEELEARSERMMARLG